MLKRTMGLSLLGLLVISGLAGRLTNNSLTKSERKKALIMMKDSRTDLINQVGELTNKQLIFKPAGQKKNIQDQVMHMAGSEKKIWELLEQAMKVNSSPSQRAEMVFDDEELITQVEDQSENGITYDPFMNIGDHFKTYSEAMEGFKKQRLDHIRYLRTSTEDLRYHVVKLSFGTLDGYQLCLLIAAHANRHMEDIRKIMEDPSFPK